MEDALGVRVVSKQALGGGDFATAYKAVLNDGEQIFVKTHSSPPDFFFSTEATGLEWLQSSGTVRVPEVLVVSDDPPFLALQWIEPGISKDDAALGASLAGLHAASCEGFGRLDHRTTGSLAVPNTPCDNWAEFYATRRLRPLAGIARERRALSDADCSKLELIADNLSASVIADDKPALLHGDLWAGNRIADSAGHSWLIDPASHAGHREFDLAMMQLFGGYSSECFAAYNEEYPLEPGFMARVPLHQLAPLVVHAIKFGDGYKSAVRSAIAASEDHLNI